MSAGNQEAILSNRIVAHNPDDVYSPIEQKYNLKPTLVYCQWCKFCVTTDLAGAKCKKCDSNMIVVTKKNELAGQTS